MFRREIQATGAIVRYQEVNDGQEWANWRERTAEFFRFFFGTPES
jgi:enterochelin esterase-like enzyme